MSAAIERVLVALDATAETRSAIGAAMRLAARAGARLHAVFVEDEELLRLPGLPFARHVVPGAGAAPLTVADLQLQVRAAAARAREELAVAARLNAVEFTFEVVHGPAGAALATASERDLVVAGALARPFAGHFRVASQWFAALDLVQGPLLLARAERQRGGGVAALLHRRSDGSARLLRTAARLAALGGSELTVFAAAPLADNADFADWVGKAIAAAAIRVRIEPAPGAAAGLRRRLAELDCALLAVSADAGADAPGQLRALAAQLDCDVLVVH